jgi:hypothetical protein
MTFAQFTALEFVLIVAVGVAGCAETPRPVSTMPDAGTVSGDPSQVQERAVSMQKSGYMNVPRTVGPRTPIPPKGGVMNFSCGMTSCTCHGDADCNNMFSSSVCGRSAVCDTSSGVECSCLRSQ